MQARRRPPLSVFPETAVAAEQEESREERARKRRGRKRVVVDRVEGLRLARELETADRMARAKKQGLRIVRRPPGGAYGEYLVASAAGDGSYRVVVRDRTGEESSCSCPDFLHNELQTCMHVERV